MGSAFMPEIVVSYKPAMLPSKFSSRQSVVKLILLFCNNFSSLYVNHRKRGWHRSWVAVKPNFFFVNVDKLHLTQVFQGMFYMSVKWFN